ncbi:hypothetical protein UJ101_01071 [Flavobacteriaceae bacterium UJ101]|nr:hypothetical protein UJ101_01071 [Flavobacteriaceae bacterium UJ101]
MDKLQLNKKTVSRLNNQEMQKVHGGLCILSTKKKCFIAIGGSVTTYQK